MCTALTLISKNGYHYFGRNMDIEYSFNQSPILVPRNFTYKNMATGDIEKTKYAIIGMGTIIDKHPMYAEALNEKGLACAGLNFPGYANWNEVIEGKINIPPYDVIPWVLGNFESVKEAMPYLERLNLVNKPINQSVPLPTLHYIVVDKYGECVVIEQTKESLKVYSNNVGVLTNSPTFDWHITNLRQYMGMKSTQPVNVNWSEEELKPLGQGVGLIGIPGDFTPASRFVRIAFLRANAVVSENEEENISEFFRMLGNVAMVRGSVVTPENKNDITLYTSCMCQEEVKYYYNTYNNYHINCIDMNKENLDSNEIKVFNYIDKLNLNYQN